MTCWQRAAAVCAALCAAAITNQIWRGHPVFALDAVIEERDGDFYPRLRNNSLLPYPVEKCTYTTDTNKPGETIAYNMDKWDGEKRAWTRAFEFAVPDL